MAFTIPLKNSFTTFIPSYYDAVFGEALYPSLYFYQIGSKRKVPLNMGTTIKIPRLRRQTGIVAKQGPSGINAVLTSPGTLCSQFVSGVLQKFAGYYANSDLALLTSMGDPNELALRDIARDLALQMDTHIMTKISGEGFLLLPGGGLTSATSATTCGINKLANLKISDIIKGVIKLQSFNNPRPADGYFPCVTHPLTMLELQTPNSLSSGYGGSWVDVNKYASDSTVEQIYRGEVGRAYGARFVTTVNGTRKDGGLKWFSAATSGFHTYLFAPEAYYVVESDGMTARTIVKPLGSGGTYDPDNTLSTVAAKVYFTAIRGFQVTTASPSIEYRYVVLPHLVKGSSRTNI